MENNNSTPSNAHESSLNQPPSAPSAEKPAKTASYYLRNWCIHAAIFVVANLILSMSGNSWAAGLFTSEFQIKDIFQTVSTESFLLNTTRVWMIVLLVDTVYSLFRIGSSFSKER